MIEFPTESPIVCATCNQPAIRRTVRASYGSKGSRQVSFDTHARAMTDGEFVEALSRLDAFHKRLYELESTLRATDEEGRKVDANGAIGRFISFDIETVHPTACEVRSHIVPSAVIQSFGIKKTVRLEAREQKGQSAVRILGELRSAVEPIIKAIKKQREEGDF